MAKTFIVNGRIYEETGARSVIVGGSVFEETTAAAGGTVTGSGAPTSGSATSSGSGAVDGEISGSGTPSASSASSSGAGTVVSSDPDLVVRFSLDNYVGVPMASTTLPDVVVYDEAGISAITATFVTPSTDATGVVTLNLGAASGLSLSVGDIVFVGSVEAIGVYGASGAYCNGTIFRCDIEEA